MRKIIATPAGRRRYLEILLEHLKVQKGDFDEWHLWINTLDEEDISYIKHLASTHEWIKCIELGIPFNGNRSVYWFFQFCTDSDSLYLRLDDDVVWMEEGAVKRIFEFREKNPQYFMVCGNVINNALCTSIHQRFGLVGYSIGVSGYECMDSVGWKSPEHAAVVHRDFLENYRLGNVDSYKFPRWELNGYERYSINVISWFGSEFAKFSGAVGVRDEQWLTEVKPKEVGKMNCIYGEALFSHFAFKPQREYLDKNTDVLDEYKCLLDKRVY